MRGPQEIEKLDEEATAQTLVPVAHASCRSHNMCVCRVNNSCAGESALEKSRVLEFIAGGNGACKKEPSMLHFGSERTNDVATASHFLLVNSTRAIYQRTYAKLSLQGAETEFVYLIVLPDITSHLLLRGLSLSFLQKTSPRWAKFSIL
jgi:hypothetical protein